MNADVQRLATALAALLTQRGLTLACAESCTGGLIGAALTDLPGSSAWFTGGVVAYANSAKENLLGVPGALLARHGAVSREAVLAMAQGARRALGTDLALAVSGIAGPDGGTPEKPVGAVWLAWDLSGALTAELRRFAGDRAAVRRQTVATALAGLIERLG